MVLGVRRWLGRLRSVGAVFVATVVLQMVVAALSMDVLSSVRGYVTGESLYSKGQKDALLHLQVYTQTYREADYKEFLAALAVPLGHSAARRALQQVPPDEEVARQGFLAGENHPSDIGGMIRLFIWAHDVPFMARAIELWTQADNAIDAVRLRVQEAREHVLREDFNSLSVRELASELPAMNQRLTQLERQFSDQLGQAARLVELFLLGLNLLVATGLALIGGRFMRKSWHLQRQKEAEMTDLVSAVGDAVVTVDADHRVVLFNRAAQQMFGCTLAQARGALLERFISGGAAALVPHDADGERVRELVGLRLDGKTLHLEASVAALSGDNGSQTAIVCRDVTVLRAEREAERVRLTQRNAELALRAHTDTLTGLPNRGALGEHLVAALDKAAQAGSEAFVLFLDLDGFKAVNDTFGHLAGDQLLVQAAARLRSAVRQTDTVFRISGDEFVVVVSNGADRKTVETVADRVLEAVRQPYVLTDAQANVTVSVGVATYPRQASDVRSLLQAADAAMYRAKQSGKNSCHFAA